ncbi:MAG: membrane protein insertion efficiency factor YidD [Actinomycetes bacterium]
MSADVRPEPTPAAGDAGDGSDLTKPRDASPLRRTGPVARLLALLVRGYQRTAVLRPVPRCRFHPTCSSYALEALQQHGAARGTWLTVRRLARCHPWNPGGVDHVPNPSSPIPASDPRSVQRTPS